MIDSLNLSPFMDGVDAGGGGGADTTPAVATPAATTPAPATSGASASPATPAPTHASATASPADREGWVPSYRVRETREAAIRDANTQFAAKEAQYQAELSRINTQLRALVGVQPSQNPEVDRIRQQFSELYPGLAKMEDRAAQLEQLLEQAQGLQTQTEHYWQSYGRQNMDRLFSLASETYGGPISNEFKQGLHTSFVGWVQASPERSERYASDPEIVQDFWKEFTSTFVEPARRVASAAAQARVPAGLPQDTPGAVAGSVTAGPKPANLDERVAQGWAQYQTFKK